MSVYFAASFTQLGRSRGSFVRSNISLEEHQNRMIRTTPIHQQLTLSLSTAFTTPYFGSKNSQEPTSVATTTTNQQRTVNLPR